MSVFRKFVAAFAIITVLCPGVWADEIRFAAGEWAPFISKDLPGFGPHAKRVSLIFEEAGFKATYKFFPWNRSYNLVKNGQYVATFSWFRTPERETEMLFPKNPITITSNVLFFKKERFPDGLVFKSYEDLAQKGLKIVGVTSYWYEAGLKKAGADSHFVSRSELAWKILASDRADIIIDELSVGQMDIKKYLGADAVLAYAHTNPVAQDPMYILFSKVHPRARELMEKYDAAYEKLKSQGQL